MENRSKPFTPGMRGILLVASFYNFAWGLFIYNFPAAFYQWVTQTQGNYEQSIEWQGLGILIFGMVYFISALYPARYWYLIAAGALSKLVGAIWFYVDIMEFTTTKKFIFHLLMNDLIWVIPLVFLAVRAYQVKS